MSTENLEQFMDNVADSAELQAKIGEKIDAALIALGAECGCEFTAEELQEFSNRPSVIYFFHNNLLYFFEFMHHLAYFRRGQWRTGDGAGWELRRKSKMNLKDKVGFIQKDRPIKRIDKLRGYRRCGGG